MAVGRWTALNPSHSFKMRVQPNSIQSALIQSNPLHAHQRVNICTAKAKTSKYIAHKQEDQSLSPNYLSHSSAKFVN